MTRVTVQGDKELVKQLEKLISRAEGPAMVQVMAAGAAMYEALAYSVASRKGPPTDSPSDQPVRTPSAAEKSGMPMANRIRNTP